MARVVSFIFTSAFMFLAALPVNAAEVTRLSDGHSIKSHYVAELTQSSLLVRLVAGESFSILDISVQSVEPSLVVLSASSASISAAVLSGVITSASTKAGAGQLLAWNIDSNTAPEVSMFDISRLLASSTLAQNSEIQAELQPAIEQQQKDIYWGRLEPIGANLQAPLPPVVEAGRRDMLLTPTLIELRRAAAGKPDSLSKLVAEKFLVALRQGDISQVSELLSPALFSEGGANGPGWQELRLRFARQLVRGRLPAAMRSASLEPVTLGQWRAVTPHAKSYLLTQSAAAETFPFIESLKAE